MEQRLTEKQKLEFLEDSKKDDPPQWFIDEANLGFAIRVKKQRLKEKDQIILSGEESTEEFERKNNEIDEIISELQIALSKYKKDDLG